MASLVMRNLSELLIGVVCIFCNWQILHIMLPKQTSFPILDCWLNASFTLFDKCRIVLTWSLSWHRPNRFSKRCGSFGPLATFLEDWAINLQGFKNPGGFLEYFITWNSFKKGSDLHTTIITCVIEKWPDRILEKHKNNLLLIFFFEP